MYHAMSNARDIFGRHLGEGNDITYPNFVLYGCLKCIYKLFLCATTAYAHFRHSLLSKVNKKGIYGLRCVFFSTSRSVLVLM